MLYTYQQDFINNTADLRYIIKGRQLGFSFVIALEAFMNAISKNCTIIFVSASERLAVELIRKVRRHKEFFEKFTGKKVKLSKDTETELHFSEHSSRILSLSTNISTARSFTADYLYMDEFAYIPNAEEIYQAIAPATTRGGKITIISTPGPAAGLFYDIYFDRETYKDWRITSIDIYQAIDQGLEVSLEELHKKIPEPDRFAVEYECKFHTKAYSYIPMRMLEQCRLPANLPKILSYYIGVDIGRKTDTTEIIVLGLGADKKYYYIEDYQLAETPFKTQRQIISDYINKYDPIGVRIDSTGIGMQLAEELEEDFPSCVQGIHFTNKIKNRMATEIYTRLDKKELLLPKEKELYSHILSVTSELKGLNYIFNVASNKHHADKFWSIGLAILATDTIEVTTEYNNLF